MWSSRDDYVTRDNSEGSAALAAFLVSTGLSQHAAVLREFGIETLLDLKETRMTLSVIPGAEMIAKIQTRLAEMEREDTKGQEIRTRKPSTSLKASAPYIDIRIYDVIASI